MVFLFLLCIILIVITSKIEIDIEKINVEYKANFNKFTSNYIARIKLKILEIVPILWITLDKNKIEKLRNSKRFKKINFKNMNFNEFKKNINKRDIKKIKDQMKINIEKFKLYLNIGVESTIFTSFLIPIISSGISVILSRKRVKNANHEFQIIPIYNNRNYSKF